MPSSGWASTIKNCPTEPVQNTPIISGETYYGTNCTLSTAADIDSFTFTASAGSTWSMVAGRGPTSATDICLTLYAPSNTTAIFSGCTSYGVNSVPDNQKLTVAGLYTIVISEPSDGAGTYGLSLERLSPAPSDGTALVLGKTVTSEVSAPSAQDAYTFYGDTSGTYEVAASIVTGSPTSVCFAVYQPGATNVAGACTSYGVNSVEAKVTPTQDGTYLVIVYAGGNDGISDYNLSVSCLLGTCTPPPPTCALKDAPTYASGTLTMDFRLATPVAATWDAWLINHNAATQLWSESEPVTEPAVTVTKTHALAPSGEVGILSTLTIPTTTTKTGGITCNNWTLVETGKP